MIYYAETEVGCSIGEARNVANARNIVQREVGTLVDIYEVRKATEEDIAWVGGMGGYLPDSLRANE